MLDSLNSKQKKIVIVIGIIILLGVIIYFFKNNSINNSADDVEILVSKNSTNNIIDKKDADDNKEAIIVHITGAVKTPGIVKLEEGCRIEDAINKAGGLTEDADITKVNLAYILEDGIKIKIPKTSDIGDLQEDTILSNESGENVLEDIEKSSQDTCININKATEQELKNLPGIGASLASKIIDYRNNNGKFSIVDDIKKVNGIGDSKFESIRDYICVK